MLKIRNYIIIIITIFILFPKYLNAEERVLAVVNNEVITTKDLADFINFIQLSQENRYPLKDIEKIKSELLDRLIEDKLILQEAKRQKIEINKNIILSRLEEIKKRYPTDKDFQEALNIQGLSIADIEKKITEQLLIYNALEKNVRSKVVVHPEEVNIFYQTHQEEFIEPERREVFALVFDNILDAQNILQELKKEGCQIIWSDNYSSFIKELGLIERGQLKKDFEDVIFNLKENEFSDVFEAENKYYIFFIKRIFPPYLKKFVEVKHMIYNMLFERKAEEKLKDWLNGLRKKSYIQLKEN